MWKSVLCGTWPSEACKRKMDPDSLLKLYYDWCFTLWKLLAAGWTVKLTFCQALNLKYQEKDPDPDPRLKHLLKSIMAEEAVKMQLYGIETGFPILYSTPPSDGDACSGGKIRVNEPNSDLCPCLESKTVLRIVWLQAWCWDRTVTETLIRPIARK